jgi:hypothetical protein
LESFSDCKSAWFIDYSIEMNRLKRFMGQSLFVGGEFAGQNLGSGRRQDSAVKFLYRGHHGAQYPPEQQVKRTPQTDPKVSPIDPRLTPGRKCDYHDLNLF